MNYRKALITIIIISICMNLFAIPTATVNDNNVRIRTAPSIKYSRIITSVNRGIELQVCAKTEGKDQIDGYTEPWYQVKYNDTYGWIYGAYITIKIESDDYIKIEQRAAMLATALYNEIYGYYFKTGPFESMDIVKKLINGKDPLSTRNIHEHYSDGTEGDCLIANYNIDNNVIEVYKKNMWSSFTITQNIPNSFSIKMGMSQQELENIFGKDFKTSYYVYPSFEIESIIKFNITNNKLNSIYISFNRLEGD